ncbi:MAG: TonB-dependent receptor [Rhizomicrobium sp.]
MSVRFHLVSYAVLAALAVSAAYADTDAATVMETVVVTAQKREQNPIEVPLSLTAYSGDFMKNVGIQEFDKLSLFVPGFEVQNQSPNNPGFVMRGITSDSGDPTQEPRVAVFEDGISITATRGSYVELFDIERVEVAKGPQSTLFGRSALIGGVNIIQNKANTEKFTADFNGEIGDYDYRLAGGAINIPVSDEFAVRISGRYKSRDGYVQNLNHGTNYNSVNTGAARLAMVWKPSEALRADFIFNFEEDSPSDTSFKSGTFAPSNPTTGTVEGTTDHNSGATLNQISSFENGKRLGLDRTVWDGKALISYKINDALTLSTTTAYRRFDSEEVFDPDGFSKPILEAAEDERSDQFSHEMRLNFDNGGRITAFAGVDYFYNNTSQRVPLQFDEYGMLGLYMWGNSTSTTKAALGNYLQNYSTTAYDTAMKTVATSYLTSSLYPSYYSAYYNALVGSYGSTVASTYAKSYATTLSSAYGSALANEMKTNHWEEYTLYGKTKSVDLYGDATAKLTEDLELDVGLRYTHDDKQSAYASKIGDRSVLGLILNGGLTSVMGSSTELAKLLSSTAVSATSPDSALDYGIMTQPTAGNGNKIARNYSDNGLAWRLALRYSVADNSSVYATYARGRRPKLLSASSPDTPYADPDFSSVHAEQVDSYEIGYKTLTLDNHLRLDMAAYFYNYTHFQSTKVDRSGSTQSFVSFDAGKAEAYGIETSADIVLTNWADMFVTYTYNRARFMGDSLYHGNQMRLNPDHKLSVGASLRRKIFDGTVTMLPTYTWQSKIYFGDDNDIASEQNNLLADTTRDELQKQYGLFDFRLTFQPDDKPWSIGLFVENAFSQKYIKDAGNTGDSLGIPTFIAGAPRFVGANVSFKFR